MKLPLNREQWLAIFENAAGQHGEAAIEARWLVVQQLDLRPDDFPGIHAALEQGRWREAKDPSAYVKTVARREVARMRRPLDPHVLSLDVVGGNEFSHDGVMDQIAYANETSTAVRGGDGVWRPGGHGEQHDEYESLSERLASATQPKQQVSINADAADAMPLPPGFSVDVGFPESVSEVHDRAKAEGYTIIEPLEDNPIGIRRFSLLDPSGTRVTIVAHLDPAHQPAR